MTQESWKKFIKRRLVNHISCVWLALLSIALIATPATASESVET